MRSNKMYVEMQVPECDFTGTRYDGEVKGAGAVAQGASGRWCVVMYVGPEYLAKHGITPLAYEDAIEKCEAKGGWAEF